MARDTNQWLAIVILRVVVPVHAMKAYRGSRGIDPLIPNLVTK
jgi:hypothetical protein